jgi:leucyl aminopeptidase
LALDTKVVFAKPPAHDCDLLAVLVPQGSLGDEKISDAHFGDLDRALSGLLKRVAAEEEFSGKEGQSLSLHTHEKIGPARLLAVGLGKPENGDRLLDALRSAASRAVKAARSAGARSLAIVWPHGGPDPAAEVQALAEGATLGAYAFDRYKQEKKPLKLASVRLLAREERTARRGGGSQARASLARAAELGCQIADATNLARDLVNEPAGRVTPKELAAVARKVAREHGLEIEVLGRPRIERLKMALFLGVAQGSEEEPQLVRLSYLPSGKGAARAKGVALVGKAITFDSGGLSIKTAQGMENMKTDMAGAAAVIGAMSLVAQTKPPFPVDGYFGACENLPSGTAYKPGDVLVGRNGTSVEVLNTDAEGRLVLGDVLAWACEREPAAVVDLATLTGAILVALGPWMMGLFSNDEALAGEILAAADAAGEPIWRMPLPREMEELIKSPVADIKNTGGRNGGSINAALFLQHFVGKTPWAHLDIAGPSALDKERGYNPRGGTGAGVRLLAEWLRRRSAQTTQ